VCDKDLLDQRNRSLIYANIYANPGIHFNDLCRALEINRGTMFYHLAVLLSSGKIAGMDYAGKTVYFTNKSCFGDTERKLLLHLKNPARMSLLQNLHTHGPLRRGDLIDKTRLSTAATAWHLKFLSDEGIVQIKKAGREAYYSIHPEMAPCLSGLMAAGHKGGITVTGECIAEV
jgi:predicted transcriptional regulator